MLKHNVEGSAAKLAEAMGPGSVVAHGRSMDPEPW